MRIHRITQSPSPELAGALSAFEKAFRYPLGPSDSFSISHGDDYPRFFRGMGDASIYAAEIDGRIVGSLAVVGRHVLLADGTSVPAAYLGDAKVVTEFRGRTVLGRLAVAARDQILADGFRAAFSVVMTGSIPPGEYTGRLGIPKFERLAGLAILRFDTAHPLATVSSPPDFPVPSFHRPCGGDPAIASELQPIALTVDGASGLLVDTRRGKRLWKSDGSEMASAHLTALRFTTARGLINLIQAAICTSAERGFPGLFTALPADSPVIGPLLEAGGGSITLAGAGVYGTGLRVGTWMVNTSEI